MAATSNPRAVFQNYPVGVHATNMTMFSPMEHPAAKFKKAFLTIGTTMLIIGAVNIILGALSTKGPFGFTALGIWDGCWYIACGSLSLASGFKPNLCNVIAGIVLSILTAFTALVAGFLGAIIAGTCHSVFDRQCQPGYIGINSTITALAFAAFVLAILHSTYCCRGSCGQTNFQGADITATFSTIGAHEQIPTQHTFVSGQPVPYQNFPRTPQSATTNPAFTTFSQAQTQPPYVSPPPYQMQPPFPSPPIYQNLKQNEP